MKKIKLHRSNLIVLIVFIVLTLLLYLVFLKRFEGPAKAILTHLDITGIGAKVVQGSGQTVTITAYDNGAVLEEYGGKVQFSSTDPAATLPSDYTFKNGTKEKAVSLNGWNEELKNHDYNAVTTKISDNEVSDIYLGVYETTGVGSGVLFCENDHSFADVTSDNNYDLNDFISSASSKSLDV